MSEPATFDPEEFRRGWRKMYEQRDDPDAYITASFPEVCAEQDPATGSICIRQLGHAEPHPWDTPNDDEAQMRAALGEAWGRGFHDLRPEFDRLLASRDSALARVAELEAVEQDARALVGSTPMPPDHWTQREKWTYLEGYRVATESLRRALASPSPCSEGRDEELLRGTLKEIP